MSKVAHFKSVGRAGTGAQETIPHYLGQLPSLVICALRDTSGGTNTYVLGTYTATNLLVTVTSSAVYDIIAFVDF